jgi:hypothetical protein
VLIAYLICAGLGVVALFVTQASIVEGYVVGSVMVVTALAAFWRLEGADYPGKETVGNFMRWRKAS